MVQQSLVPELFFFKSVDTDIITNFLNNKGNFNPFKKKKTVFGKPQYFNLLVYFECSEAVIEEMCITILNLFHKKCFPLREQWQQVRIQFHVEDPRVCMFFLTNKSSSPFWPLDETSRILLRETGRDIDTCLRFCLGWKLHYRVAMPAVVELSWRLSYLRSQCLLKYSHLTLTFETFLPWLKLSSNLLRECLKTHTQSIHIMEDMTAYTRWDFIWALVVVGVLNVNKKKKNMS